MTLTVTDTQKKPDGLELVYHPKTLVLGMGCERHAAAEEAIALAEQALATAGLARESVAAIASIDLKADEAAIHAIARHFGVPARFFTPPVWSKRRRGSRTPLTWSLPKLAAMALQKGQPLPPQVLRVNWWCRR